MKTKLILVILIISFHSFEILAQETTNPIRTRFPSGEKGFIKFLIENTKYPDSSKNKSSYGFSITRVSITPNGEIEDIKIINPIDQYIDNEVIHALNASKNKWKTCDTCRSNQIFYVQIAFTFFGITPNYCESKSKIYESLFIEPVVLTALSIGNQHPTIYSDSQLAEFGNTLINEGKFKEAIVILNELLKRDPFNKGLYEIRIKLNSELGRIESVNKDNDIINNFAEGHSLDQILTIE